MFGTISCARTHAHTHTPRKHACTIERVNYSPARAPYWTNTHIDFCLPECVLAAAGLCGVEQRCGRRVRDNVETRTDFVESTARVPFTRSDARRQTRKRRRQKVPAASSFSLINTRSPARVRGYVCVFWPQLFGSLRGIRVCAVCRLCFQVGGKERWMGSQSAAAISA